MSPIAPPCTHSQLTVKKADDPALTAAARSFEAIFVRNLISAMRAADLDEDLLGSSASGNFQELADARTADALTARGQFGVAHLLEAQFRPAGAAHG
jgi:flagellar protein FlgJ